MRILYKYIHGSEDSVDLDVCYIVDKLPKTIKECQEFCRHPIENRNLATIDPSTMTIADCYIGLPDELNNSLIATYPLHKQEYPMVLNRVKRHPMLKVIRATRVILTFLTRTKYRQVVKQALRSNSLTMRLNVLKNISLTSIDTFNKKLKDEDIKKKIAFQIGQTILLLNGKEVYTKAEIVNELPELRQYIYREPTDNTVLDLYLKKFIDTIPNFTENNGIVDGMYDVTKERVVKI